jgi:hypothetical protein
MSVAFSASIMRVYIISTLTMEIVSKMTGCNSILTRLIAREDFIAFNDNVLTAEVISCGVS